MYCKLGFCQTFSEFPGYIPFKVPIPDICPFIVLLFSLAQAQFHFYTPFFEVKCKGYEGIAFFFGFTGNALDFVPVQKELFFPVGIVVEDGGKRVLRDF